MFILFFALWIIFNGKFTIEIAIFGLIIAAAMYAFVCRFMDFSIKKDLMYIKKGLLFLHFFAVLVTEILKANITMCGIILTKYEKDLKPVVFKLPTSLKSRVSRVLLANAITLTPGTITVNLTDDALYINAVDASLVIPDDGSFIFEKLLLEMEKVS